MLLGAACHAPTRPAFPDDGPPAELTLTVGGFGIGAHDVALHGDAVVAVRRPEGPPAGATTVRVVPSTEAWRAFWRAAEAAGVREWPASCRNTSILDGGGFTLVLAYRGTRIQATGANSYPRRGRCNGIPEASSEYRAFLDAIAGLIGRSYP